MAPFDLSISFTSPVNRQDGTTSATGRHVTSPDPTSAGELSPKGDAGRYSQKPEHIMTKLLGDKSREWHDLTNRRGPLRLLDLPVDVLNLVIKEVTHTNDLVALALTHSALHKLTTPQIYSRFDIVWPDSALQPEGRTGVDALTYGLATLVMAEDVFGESPNQRPQACTNCGHCDTPQLGPSPPTESSISRKVRKRRGNYYAEFTRKFSLGNGPEEWIKEYLTNTESGKMLGTLVALAIARMRSLETFIWDMPTGILQDVWNALASLGEREDGKPCRLERVWVRWHNNSPLDKDHRYMAVPTAHNIHTFWQSYSEIMQTNGHHSAGSAVIDKKNKVERPTFSMLPPLKGLNVLDIDECAYLDEMSILISESRHCLKELRVGIADHSVAANWAYPWPDHELSQVAEGKSRFSSNISALEKRLGGVLGVLTGYIFDLKKELAEANKQAEPQNPDAALTESKTEASETAVPSGNQTELPIRTTSQRSGRARFVEDLPSSTPESANDDDFSQLGCAELINTPFRSQESKLRLETLALERVSLSIPILSNAFDWTTLRDLTLLDCQFTAMFWSLLRRQYTPTSVSDHSLILDDPDRYPLKLRRIHTNTVTPILLAFLRETLAPNTLEVLFLQQSEYHYSKVPPEKIMSVIKRHRGSLKKILIDSSERDDSDRGSARAEGWSQWQFNRSMINFITSGKMPKLRELGIAVAFKDWHYLLQRLPFITHLRALYLTYLTKSANSFVPTEESKELACQVLDILTIRPEIELCYLAITSKCFEIIESRVKPSDLQLDESAATARPSLPTVSHLLDPEAEDEETEGDDDADDDSAADPADEDDEGEEDADADADAHESEGEDEESFGSEGESEGDEETSCRVKMELREILFYDDKVAVFKARHGRL